MIDDLIDSKILLGKNSIEVTTLLGEPEYEIDNKYTYTIREKYGFDIDPNYIRILTVKFDPSGKVDDMIDSSIN